MSPTSYQAAPPRTDTIADESARVKSLVNLVLVLLAKDTSTMDLAQTRPGSFKLLSELSELLFQIRNLILERRDFLFHLSHSVFIEYGFSRLRRRRVSPCLRLCLHDVARQKVGIARFFRACLPRKLLNERRLTLHQMLQARLHGPEILEGMHTLGAASQFPWRLRPPQQQQAQDSRLVAIEVEGFLQPVLVFGH